jgi:hypothetical protein
MQPKHRPDVSFAHLLFVIGVAQKGQRHPVGPQRRLDDIGQVMFSGFGVEVLQALARVGLVGLQIEIGAVGEPKLYPPKGTKIDVAGALEYGKLPFSWSRRICSAMPVGHH